MQRLNMWLKGGRSYVHGTDMYNVVSDWVGRERAVTDLLQTDIRFHQIVTTDLMIDALPGAGAPVDTPPAVVYACTVGKTRQTFAMWPAPADRILPQVPFPEHEITRTCQVDADARSATLRERPDYTDVEICSAVNKHLHESLLPEATAQGKWFAVRFEAGRYARVTPFQELRLELLSVLGGFGLTRTRILMDGNPYGFIYFSLRRHERSERA